MDTRSILETLMCAKGANCDPTQFDLKNVEQVVGNLRHNMIAIASFEALIGLVLVAWNYFTAYGDEAKAEKAKKRMLWIIVGVTVVIFAEILLYEVFNYFVPAYENQAPQIDNSLNPFKTP